MRNRTLFSSFSLLLLLSCAHQLSPGGGPADTHAPEILISSPEDRSVSVPKNSKITISFSEWVSKKNRTIVSIFPPLKHTLKINKNRIDIIPLELMADSQTYHIIVSPSLQDLHANFLEKSHSLVFSTGSSLDSGVLSGCVINPTKKNLRVEIALFNNSNFMDSGFAGTPSYRIETDTLGTFSLNYLKKGNYRIAGFPSKISSSEKSVPMSGFIPEDSIITITTDSSRLYLFPAVIDTAFPYLSTPIKAESNKIAVGTWNKMVDTSIFKLTSRLISADSSGKDASFKSIYFGKATQLGIVPEKSFIVAPWKFIYSVSRVFDTVTFTDTILFNSTDRPDTTKPTLRTSGTLSKHFLNQPIVLTWSEPVKITSPLFLYDTLGDTVLLSCDSNFNDTTKLLLHHSLKTSSQYKLTVLNKNGADLSGNLIAAKDSSDTVATIVLSVIDDDSIAISIQGTSECGFPKVSGLKKWIYFPVGESFHFISNDRSNTFKFDSLPAGNGTIGVFIDKNNNNLPDPGSLIPWRSPEPHFLFADTVEARPRWDVEGILLKKCPSCIAN